MNSDILNWFIENIDSEEPIIIFGSSGMYLHNIENDFNDVDLALSKIWIQKLYKKIILNSNIQIDWETEKIEWIKLWNVNVNNFWDSIKLKFNIKWLGFEWFVEKKENNSIFWKYFKDLNKYTKSLGKTQVKVLKPKYLSEVYIKIVSKELESFNKTLETLDSGFILKPWTDIKKLNNFLEKNWEVFDKKILKIFNRTDNIKKLNNFKLKK